MHLSPLRFLNHQLCVSRAMLLPLYLCPTEMEKLCVPLRHNDALHPASRGKQGALGPYLHEDDKATLTQKLTSVHKELSV